MKTQALKMALDQYGYDLAFGGAEEMKRNREQKKEFSFRTETHTWDPKNQRPELWNNFNTRKRIRNQ